MKMKSIKRIIVGSITAASLIIAAVPVYIQTAEMTVAYESDNIIVESVLFDKDTVSARDTLTITAKTVGGEEMNKIIVYLLLNNNDDHFYDEVVLQNMGDGLFQETIVIDDSCPPGEVEIEYIEFYTESGIVVINDTYTSSASAGSVSLSEDAEIGGFNVITTDNDKYKEFDENIIVHRTEDASDNLIDEDIIVSEDTTDGETLPGVRGEQDAGDGHTEDTNETKSNDAETTAGERKDPKDSDADDNTAKKDSVNEDNVKETSVSPGISKNPSGSAAVLSNATGNVSVTKAAPTGDAGGYAALTGYTMMAAAAVAASCIVILHKRKHND